MGVLSVYRMEIDERDLLQLLRNDVICRLLKDPGVVQGKFGMCFVLVQLEKVQSGILACGSIHDDDYLFRHWRGFCPEFVRIWKEMKEDSCLIGIKMQNIYRALRKIKAFNASK